MVKRLRWCHDIELLGQRSSTGADTSGPFLMAACCPSQPAENLPFAFHLQTLPFPQACRDFSFKITASSQLRLSEVGRADIAVWDHSAFNCYCLLIKINCGHQGGRKSHMILVFSFRWFFSQWEEICHSQGGFWQMISRGSCWDALEGYYWSCTRLCMCAPHLLGSAALCVV